MIGFDGGGSKHVLMVVALNTSLYLDKWKGFMVRKDRRNNFFLFENEDKTQGYTGELGSKIITTVDPQQQHQNACWYFLTHTEIIRKRTELPL
jgi:hypothetical protein